MLYVPHTCTSGINKQFHYEEELYAGGNLIVAFDCTGIMNAAVIEGIIKNEVIPRL